VLTWSKQNPPENDLVWGVAYHIIPEKVDEVREYLDIREINGYSIQYTPFVPAEEGSPERTCLVYIGMPDNPQFLGALQPQAVAEKINESIGPSGENRDYLLQLDEALRTLSPDSHDEHISDLARRVRSMTPPTRSTHHRRLSKSGLQRVSSTEEQEEVEKTA
jgi:glutathione-specific gamma-glutamylcyclotransferase